MHGVGPPAELRGGKSDQGRIIRPPQRVSIRRAAKPLSPWRIKTHRAARGVLLGIPDTQDSASFLYATRTPSALQVEAETLRILAARTALDLDPRFGER